MTPLKTNPERNEENSLHKLAHDLNSSLAVIKGTLHNLSQGILGPLNPKQQQAMERMDITVNKIKGLMESYVRQEEEGQ